MINNIKVKIEVLLKSSLLNKISLISAIAFLSCYTLPLLRVIINGYCMLILAFVWTILTLFLDFKAQTRNIKGNILYGIWLFILCVYFIMGRESKLSIQLIIYGAIFFIFLIADYYILSEDNNACRIILYSQLICLSITAIYSLFYLIFVNKDAARILATNRTIIDSFMIGVGGYGFVYATVGLVPAIIIFASDLNKRFKVISYAFVGLMLVAIYFSYYAMAYMFVILLIIAALYIVYLKKECTKKSIIILIAGPIIAIIAALFLINNPMVVSNIYMQERLVQIKDIFSGKQLASDTNTVIRLNNYITSLDGIVKYPFTGCVPLHSEEYNMLVGGHTQWLDLIARYGIILGCLPIFFIFKKFNFYMARLDSTNKKSMLLFCVYFILLGFFNPNFIEIIFIVLFVIIPNLKYVTDDANLYNKK